MYNLKDLEAILQGKSSLNQIFDNNRIVYVDNHTICKYIDGKITPTKEKCYGIWEQDEICTNCTSHQAFIEQKQIIKLQYFKNNILLVISVPICINEAPYVLELIKDITESMVFQDSIHHENCELRNLINRLNIISEKDPFTDLFNKKYIDKQIKEDIRNAKKNNENYVLALIDIDKFKNVNDTYGHIYGDMVIKDIVNIIHKHIDGRDCWAARYGGDEFLLVFRNRTYEDVQRCCKLITNEINYKSYSRDSKKFHITVSIGIYQFNPQRDTYETLIDNVDAKMYNDKNKI
ncbi:GGDEF domain-containing protein [Anaerocolumna sp.]|uniref:GGDEF domain-containing protein n=1 Tax=Anaerocolumna sp. TaxID=2041569 RepID=UPI0028AEC56B|nr:GGDEF domain-containing protein [Anaerocolumna sp.]